jgi:hypothetical protein
MSRWFRFYDTALDDPKVQRLTPDIFKAWVNILCLASRNEGILPSMHDIAFALRLPDHQADTIIMALIEAGLLEDNQGDLIPHNWHKRQFLDRTNAQRQRRYRERLKVETSRNAVTNDHDNVTITSQDTDTDTDTDSSLRSESKSKIKLKKNSEGDADFAAFWIAYPRKTAKEAGRKAWVAATKRATAGEIMAGLSRYSFSTDPQFIPHPATWLNQHRWADETASSNADEPRKELTHEEQLERSRRFWATYEGNQQ